MHFTLLKFVLCSIYVVFGSFGPCSPGCEVRGRRRGAASNGGTLAGSKHSSDSYLLKVCFSSRPQVLPVPFSAISIRPATPA